MVVSSKVAKLQRITFLLQNLHLGSNNKFCVDSRTLFCCQGAKFSSTTSDSPFAKLRDFSFCSGVFLKRCLLVYSVQKTAGYRFPVAVEKDDKY